MFKSLKLPESPSNRRRLSISTLDSYSDFRNHLLNNEEPSDNFDDNINTFPTNDKRNARQFSPLDLKLKKSFNRVGIEKSNVAGLNKEVKKEMKKLNSNEGYLLTSVSTKRIPAKMKPAANAVNNKRVTRSTSRNKENNLPALPKISDVPEKKSKRKLFDPEALSKNNIKKSKTGETEKSIINQTNKSLPGLSDTAVSVFLRKFDQEMIHESDGQPVKNLVTDTAPLLTKDLPKTEHCNMLKKPNQRCYKKLPKRKSAHQSQKTVAQLFQEEFSSTLHKNDYDSDDSLLDKDFKIDERASTSNESSITNVSEDIQNKSSEIAKKIDLFVKEETGSNFSDTNSICSIASTTSRYGRVRKASSVYINATIFGGNSRKSADIKRKAETLINSHKCKSRSSIGMEDTSRSYLDQVNFLSPTHKRMDSPEFKTPANIVTPSKNRLTTRRSQSRTSSSASQKSLLVENHPNKQTPNQFNFLSPIHRETVSLQSKPSVNQAPSSANVGSNLSNSRRSRSRSSNTSKKSSFIADAAEKQSLNQSDCISPPRNRRISPQFNQTTPSTSGNKTANSSNDQRALESQSETFNKNCSTEKETNLKMCKLDGAHDTYLPEVIFKKPLAKNEFNRSTCSSQKSETSPKSKKIIVHQNLVLRPPNEQEKPVKHVKPSIYNLCRNSSLPRTSQSGISHATFQTSNDDFEDLFDDNGRRQDPNEIHAVVNDEVVSFKWYAPMPDLDSVLSDENVHLSMVDLRSFYTNVNVGYLKVDAGQRKSMKVLRDCIMLYFVERGEAIFRMSEREITGQIGSTFFIPLGVEYTITNLKTEDLILKFIKMSPTASVL